MMQRSIVGRAGLCLALVAALLGGGAATAAAHIQVTPTLAAPNDAVKFTVLVPGERSDASTVRVALKVPRGVLPYSYGATPGWTRRLILAKDQSVDQIVWSGDMASDGFVEFSFLAATPPHPGVVAWKALQTYSDGDVVRWIGAPSSEEPAPRTEIRADAPLQNAGGEGASGSNAAGAAETVPMAAETDSSSGMDWLARGLGIAAVVIALAGLALVLTKRREQQ